MKHTPLHNAGGLVEATKKNKDWRWMFVNLVLGRLKQKDHLFKISLAVNRDTHTRAKRREEVTAESSATDETSIPSPHTPKVQEPQLKREQKDGRSQRSGRTGAKQCAGRDRSTALRNSPQPQSPVQDLRMLQPDDELPAGHSFWESEGHFL